MRRCSPRRSICRADQRVGRALRCVRRERAAPVVPGPDAARSACNARRANPGVGLRRRVAGGLRFFHYTLPVRLLPSPLFSLMQRLACLAVLLLLCAPLVSRTLADTSRFLDAPLCHSQPWQLSDASEADGSSVHAMRRLADAQAGAAHQELSAEHRLHNAGGGNAGACEYCLLATRLLPLLLMACLLFAPVRDRLAVARRAVAGPVAARWWAHAPRGPPLVA
ncbi:DUF2946 family protein [Xanthomonas campestris pv. raphani]|uniref:DUF2946 family protein n=2 Tax=Xanthomonas campestris TaxID=339 RepID=UPI002B38F53D|nr:DUF2946 family protein [Xanthomonas campestris pv. raphani]